MRNTAIMIANALLEHHADVCVPHTIRPPIRDQCVITYGDLCRAAGCPGLDHVVGEFLGEIAGWCEANRWPPINALAVNAASRIPGGGYDLAAGCDADNWEREIEACIVFTGYPASV